MRRSLLPLFVLIAVLVAGLAWMRWGRAPFPAADSSLEHRSDEERARTEDASAELANVVRETGGESRTEEEAEGSEREPIGMRAAVPVLRAESNDSALVVRVVDVHGRPVPEALVLGVREGSSGFESTDERGVLRIDEPTPGRKLLTARAIGWLDSESVEVYVAAGERVEVELWLRDFGRIEGRVTSFAGRPMESWTVAIEAQRRNHGRKGVLATTDARGHFAIDEVEPGPRTLLIDPPAGARGDDGGAPVVQNSARHAVEVESFETSVVKIEVEDLGPVLVRVVVTRGGEPVAGESVELSYGGVSAPLWGESCEVVTDERGVTQIQLARPGRLHVFVAENRREVDVPATDVHTVAIALPGGRLRGTVRGLAEMQVGRVWVRALEVRDPRMPPDVNREISVALDGSFEVSDLQRGKYAVRAGAGFMGYVVDYREDYSLGRSPVRVVEVGDGLVDDVVLDLDEPARLSGRVVGPDGELARSAWVVVADERGFVQQTEFVDGRLFSLRLGPGTARIAAFTASGASDWTEVDLRPGLQTEVELVARPAGRLEIVSKDAEGKPLRAVVRATDARGLGHHAPLGIDITRFDGGAVPRDHVTRFGALPPGDYTVRGWSYDGRAGQRTVRVTAGETERVALVLGE